MATPQPGPSGSSSESTSQRELLQAVNDVFTVKMSELKRELVQEQEESNERLVKRLRLEKPPVFKKKTHEVQFRFNEDVRSKMSAAAGALSQAPPAVEKAQTLLEEGEKLINNRQKCIKIADRSEHGWATVEEYEEDELAENSDDEKRLFRAEARAGRRLKAAAAKSFKRKGQPGAGRRPGQDARVAHVQSSTGVAAWQLAAAARQSIPVQAGYGAVQSKGFYPPGRMVGPCWQCGKDGHFRAKCPLLVGSIPKQ